VRKNLINYDTYTLYLYFNQTAINKTKPYESHKTYF